MPFIPTARFMVRLISFITIFALIIFWERIAPKRKNHIPRTKRWPINIGAVVLNQLLIKILIPFSAIEIALITTSNNWGILHQITIDSNLKIIIGLLLLDLSIYFQHLCFHYIPILWRFHQIHHLDQEFDLTTGIRFHPIEIIISLFYKFAIIIFLGITPFQVLIFEIILNAMAMFNHGNIRLPFLVDKYLRIILVTPDMHRVHHSVLPKEFNRNFGFNFSFWDRLFKTYKADSQAGQLKMQIGQIDYPDFNQTGALRLLTLPFITRRKNSE